MVAGSRRALNEHRRRTPRRLYRRWGGRNRMGLCRPGSHDPEQGALQSVDVLPRGRGLCQHHPRNTEREQDNNYAPQSEASPRGAIDDWFAPHSVPPHFETGRTNRNAARAMSPSGIPLLR